jgi:hypothetical protein
MPSQETGSPRKWIEKLVLVPGSTESKKLHGFVKCPTLESRVNGRKPAIGICLVSPVPTFYKLKRGQILQCLASINGKIAHKARAGIGPLKCGFCA